MDDEESELSVQDEGSEISEPERKRARKEPEDSELRGLLKDFERLYSQEELDGLIIPPTATDKQIIEIENAQVDFMKAQLALQSQAASPD